MTPRGTAYDGYEGIKEDQYGVRAYVKVGKTQKSKRFPRGTPVKTITDWQDRTRVALRDGHVPVAKDLLRNDAERYLTHMKATLAPATYASRVCEINAWLPALGHLRRQEITREHILDVRHGWLTDPDEPRAPKTCNHRTRALAHLYRYLDGKRAPTPVDDLKKLAEPDPAPQFIDAEMITRVLQRITNPKTRGRFMVLVSTGQRPAQLQRAKPEDVDLVRGFWYVRAAKGGNPIPVVLNSDMIAAWEVFIAADAWTTWSPRKRALVHGWDSSQYAKDLYAAGWPKHIRPYNAKHTVAMTLASAGAEWEDIKDWLGHKQLKSTRIYSGPVVLERLRGISETLSGRLGWGQLGAKTGSQLGAKTGSLEGRDGSRLVKNRRNLSVVKTAGNS